MRELRKYVKYFKAVEVIIEKNLQTTDFLDVTFNLKNGKYYPFRKPNNDPMLSQIIQKTSSKKFVI